MPDTNALLRSLLSKGSIAALFLLPAQAQSTSFHLPAQQLAASLTEVARQTGRGILFTPDAVHNVSAAPVDGNFTAEQAVTQLIAGTSLEVVSDASGNLVVRASKRVATTVRPDDQAPSAPREPLETVRVVATRQSGDVLQFLSRVTINVLSAADLEHTAVHNAAEALQLLPGINVTNTGNSFFGGIDGASRGEGMFAQVRGMNSEFTLNLINGVDVAQGMPYSREVQLSLLPPSGLQTIVVSKTAQADLPSDFIGGVIDFRTPTAFDFADDQTFSVTIGGRGETRAMDYGQNGLGGLASAAASKKFGADNQFGIYVSGYYDIRQFANSELGALMEISGDNAWAFAVSDATGHNPVGYNPGNNLQSTGFNIGISSGYTARYGATASLEWKLDDTTSLHARLTYAYAHTEQNSTLSQIIGSGVSTGSSGIAIGTTDFYLPNIASVSTRLWYETNPEMADLGTAQIGGEKRFSDKLILSTNVFYSWGNNDRPNHIEISARPASDFAHGSTALLSYGTNNFPLPSLSQAMFDRLGDIGANPARRAGQLTVQHSGQDKLGVTLDADYAVGTGILDSVKIGFKTETSWRATDNTNYTNAKYTDGTLFSTLGLYSASWSQVYPGKYTWPVPKIDQAALFKLFYSKLTTNSSDSCATPALLGICNTLTGREAVTSGYAMATLRFGDMDIIPGLRYEHTRIHNVFWQDTLDGTGAWISGAFSSNNTSYDEVLPSLLLNWRPSESSVYRASIWTGYTRPAFVQLANATTVSKNDAYSSITVGNPDLKPVEAFNFDLSGQWSNAVGGYAQVTAFAKALSNYLYNAGSEQVNAGTISHVTKPENGGSGHVYGLEFEFRQSFDTLPGWLSGFAIAANYTQIWTKVDLGANTMLHNERIQNAPDSMINAQLLYEKYGFQFDMLWHYSGAYVARYDVLSQGASWDDEWIRPMQRVDLHVGYNFSNGFRIDGSVSNLCDNITYWSHVGAQSLAISDIVDTGRTALLTLKYSY